jgi:hypothetical protein
LTVFKELAFDRLEFPTHAHHQIFSKTLADEVGFKAASFQQAQCGQRHAAVADVIGYATNDNGFHKK